MARKKYSTPTWFGLEDENDTGGSVIGEGTGQGSITYGMSFEEWWEDIAWEGTNPDADYNGDGEVTRADYDYYMANHLWEG